MLIIIAYDFDIVFFHSINRLQGIPLYTLIICQSISHITNGAIATIAMQCNMSSITMIRILFVSLREMACVPVV